MAALLSTCGLPGSPFEYRKMKTPDFIMRPGVFSVFEFHTHIESQMINRSQRPYEQRPHSIPEQETGNYSFQVAALVRSAFLDNPVRNHRDQHQYQ